MSDDSEEENYSSDNENVHRNGIKQFLELKPC